MRELQEHEIQLVAGGASRGRWEYTGRPYIRVDASGAMSAVETHAAVGAGLGAAYPGPPIARGIGAGIGAIGGAITGMTQIPNYVTTVTPTVTIYEVGATGHAAQQGQGGGSE